jgi:crossover junction endodeoxyribonuclease RuvC
MVYFMGVDPGLNKTGVGIVGWDKGKLHYIDHALVKSTADESLPVRLGQIIGGVQEIAVKYDLHSAAVENIFHSVNARSALILGQTRGAIMAALIMRKVPIFEYTALQIKQAVVGYGKAEKEQVKKMVETLLGVTLNKVALDVSDALACGICLTLAQTSKIR